MKFTRKQELYLIELGTMALLEHVMPKPKAKPKAKGKKWTKAQRAKFNATMTKKFEKDKE